MALFKILKGNEANLPSEKHEGWAYVTEKGNMYVDLSNSTRVKIGSRADSAVEADRASGDKSTETIRSKYLARIKQVTSNGTSFTFRGETGDGTNAPDLVSIPLAGDNAGLVSNAAQTIKGLKTFANGIKFPDVTSTTYPAKSQGLSWAGSTDGAKIYYEVQASDKGILVVESTDDTNAGAVFRNSSSGKEVSIINGTVTGTFSGNLTGAATSATKDSLNQNISETYMKYPLTISGETITMFRGDGVNSTITVPDKKVQQSSTSAANFRPVVLGATHTATVADLANTIRDQVYVTTKFYASPSKGIFVAPEFQGKLTGKADTAGTADYAISDEDGNNIAATYVASVLAQSDNKTVRVTKGDGTYNDVKLYFAASSSFGGAADSANILNGYKEGSITNRGGDGKLRYSYNVSNGTTGLFAVTNNANAIITLNKHAGSYDSQLGFSSNGKIYYRSFNGGALDSTTKWKEIAFTDGTIENATYAEKDKEGNIIASTYIAYPLTISGETITMKKGDGTSGTITVPDRKVYQSETTTGNYRPIVLGYTNNSDASKLAVETREQVYLSTKFYAQPSTGTLVATTFKGALKGNADTATNATYAEKDKDGNVIAATYIATLKQVTSNGTTFTFRGVSGNGTDRPNLITVPLASTSVAGLVSNADQEFAGTKRFNGALTLGAWSCTIKCATWSRICYIPAHTSVSGGAYIFALPCGGKRRTFFCQGRILEHRSDSKDLPAHPNRCGRCCRHLSCSTP